jgi:hypothetical protein
MGFSFACMLADNAACREGSERTCPAYMPSYHAALLVSLLWTEALTASADDPSR